ncbi:MAG: divergent polysaccharide deacetylase family protein [Thermodesulfobacteriota bacterium]
MAKRSRGGKGLLTHRVPLLIGTGIVLLLFTVAIFYRPLVEWWRVPEEVARVEKIPPFIKPPRTRVAIVIDDMGRDMESLRDIRDLGVPITVAVLPYLTHSRKVAEEARAMGSEVLLHLPMEPVDMAHNDPGKGALLTGMNEAEVTAQVESNLDALPFIDGVNNHMGSRFTGDERLMRVALETVKRRGNLFFLDSRTTADSKAYRIARELGLRAAKREIFLDNRRERAYIKGQVATLIDRAKQNGQAVAIGHPHEETISALREMLPLFKDEGVSVVPLSELIE